MDLGRTAAVAASATVPKICTNYVTTIEKTKDEGQVQSRVDRQAMDVRWRTLVPSSTGDRANVRESYRLENPANC